MYEVVYRNMFGETILAATACPERARDISLDYERSMLIPGEVFARLVPDDDSEIPSLRDIFKDAFRGS